MIPGSKDWSRSIFFETSLDTELGVTEKEKVRATERFCEGKGQRGSFLQVY